MNDNAKQVFAIYDSKADAYMEPWFTINTDTAVRAFAYSANDHEHPLGQSPSDYTLFHLGRWDERSGKLEAFDTKIALGLAQDFVKPPKDSAAQLDIEDQLGRRTQHIIDSIGDKNAFDESD